MNMKTQPSAVEMRVIYGNRDDLVSEALDRLRNPEDYVMPENLIADEGVPPVDGSLAGGVRSKQI